MPLPAPTVNLLTRMRHVAILLDTVAANLDADTEKHRIAAEHSNTVWSAIRRLEDLASLVEDLAPAAHVHLRITDASGDTLDDREYSSHANHG